MNHIAKLKSIPLFKDLAEDDLRWISNVLTERQFEPGELVFHQGDAGDELFLVVDGQFQVFIAQASLGFEKELARLGPGAYFGEIGLLTKRRRIASIRALAAGKTLSFHSNHLEDLFARSPLTSLALCRGMADYVEQSRQGASAVAFVNLDDYPRAKEFRSSLPPRVAVLCRALVIDGRDGKAVVAMVDPWDSERRDFLRNVLRTKAVEFVAIAESDYERHRHLHAEHAAVGSEPPGSTPTLAFVNADGMEEPLGQHETTALLQTALSGAIQTGASDVHFEPGLNGGRIRWRVDGNMISLPEPVPAKSFKHLISRLKVMSDLDITDRRLPQDGRFHVRAGDRHVEVRVSVAPCQGGEKAVLRLFDPAQRKIDLNNLILSRPVALAVREMFLAPSGLLLVCGPTGSGKTTTLYAGLREVWEESRTVNIVTVEDPVEYQLDYATQISVNRVAGLDFPHILRSILRQDPDVVLVGEIRDVESANLAVEAGQTGHLVLSSLHTDTALDSIARLRNLQVKPYLLSAALGGVICQRLVPRICVGCATAVPDDDRELNLLRRSGIIESGNAAVYQRGRGCEACGGRGEVGRVGVFEILTISDRLRDLIENNASWTEMNECLTPDVFIPLSNYGRFLLQEGIVAPERIRELFPAKRLAESTAS